jgi:hypothetical protein
MPGTVIETLTNRWAIGAGLDNGPQPLAEWKGIVHEDASGSKDGSKHINYKNILQRICAVRAVSTVHVVAYILHVNCIKFISYIAVTTVHHIYTPYAELVHVDHQLKVQV